MGQALISPAGETLLFRHKLRPSGGEREIWSDGTIHGLQVIPTPYGRWGLLECWEHFHPAMTFNVQSQAETFHIASWPCKCHRLFIFLVLCYLYSIDMPDEKNAEALSWESLEVNSAAARTYAVNSGAPLAMAAVGNVRFFGSDGFETTITPASTSFDDVPLVYSSFNTTGLRNTVPYSTNGEQSWGVLQQIYAGFPKYIPKVIGEFVEHHTVRISSLIAASK